MYGWGGFLVCLLFSRGSAESMCKLSDLPNLSSEQVWSCSDEQKTTEVLIGEKCSLQCAPGYSTTKPAVVRASCTADGWTKVDTSELKCLMPATCFNVLRERLTHGTWKCTDQMNEKCLHPKEGSVCELMCPPGFHQNEEKLSVCTTRGWEPKIEKFKCLSCPPPMKPENGIWSCGTSKSTNETVCFLYCDPGFVNEGLTATTCKQNGEYKPAPNSLSCRAVHGAPYRLISPMEGPDYDTDDSPTSYKQCPPLDTPDFGRFECEHYSCRLVCNEGYRSPAVVTATCMNGTWCTQDFGIGCTKIMSADETFLSHSEAERKDRSLSDNGEMEISTVGTDSPMESTTENEDKDSTQKISENLDDDSLDANTEVIKENLLVEADIASDKDTEDLPEMVSNTEGNHVETITVDYELRMEKESEDYVKKDAITEDSGIHLMESSHKDTDKKSEKENADNSDNGDLSINAGKTDEQLKDSNNETDKESDKKQTDSSNKDSAKGLDEETEDEVDYDDRSVKNEFNKFVEKLNKDEVDLYMETKSKLPTENVEFDYVLEALRDRKGKLSLEDGTVIESKSKENIQTEDRSEDIRNSKEEGSKKDKKGQKSETNKSVLTEESNKEIEESEEEIEYEESDYVVSEVENSEEYFDESELEE